MNKVTLTKGAWVEVATGVTSFSFNLLNEYPDPVSKCGYKIYWGAAEPAVDSTTFNYYELERGEYALPVQFTNTTPLNIYVMSVFADGYATY